LFLLEYFAFFFEMNVFDDNRFSELEGCENCGGCSDPLVRTSLKSPILKESVSNMQKRYISKLHAEQHIHIDKETGHLHCSLSGKFAFFFKICQNLP
jgi:hypothetical protein